MIRKIRTILVVGSDQAAIRPLAAILKAHGHSVLIARDLDHALSILEFRALEVVIADIEALNGHGEGLMSYIGSIVPKPRIVAVGSSNSAETACSLLEQGVDLLLPNPVDSQKLLAFLEPSPARSSFSGFVDNVDLLEYLQFLILSGKKTVLEVTSDIGTQSRIYLADGLILHANCGLLEGEPALYSCICFREGTFAHLPWKNPEQMTIHKSSDSLLLEAVRKRDDAWSEDIKDNESD